MINLAMLKFSHRELTHLLLHRIESPLVDFVLFSVLISQFDQCMYVVRIFLFVYYYDHLYDNKVF